MIVLKLILFTLLISGIHCRHPDKVYCVNNECDGPISKAKTLLSYASVDPEHISFRGNSDAIVLMKSAGTNSELWYVNIKGQSGFVNSKFLKEYKIIEKNLITVPYEPKGQENVQPDKVQQAHEVIEGTTIYTTEAAVNNAQEDATTEAPVNYSNEDLTPTLDSANETPNDKVDINNENETVPSQDGNEVSENQPSDSQESGAPSEQPQSDVDTTEVPEQTDTPIETNEANQSTETASETEAKPEDVTRQEEQPSMQQVDEKLPEELPSETSAQQLFSAASGALNTDPLVPDNKVTETEQTDSKEQNTSSSNTNVEDVQLSQDTSSESNTVLNGEVNPVNEPASDPTETLVPPPEAQNVNNQDSNPSNINGIETNDNVPPHAEPLVNQDLEAKPAEDPVPTDSETAKMSSPDNIPSTTETELPAPELPNEPVVPPAQELPAEPLPPPVESPAEPFTPPAPIIPPVLDTIPPIPPVIESIPTLPPVTTQTIPAFYPPEPQHTPDTIPQNVNIEQLAFEKPQELPFTDDYTTTSPLENDVPNNQETVPEPPPPQDLYLSDKSEEQNIPSNEQKQEELDQTTEAPAQNENSEGFFSNMYSSVADIWPSSTEAPPSIYNTDEYPTYESEKNDKTEVNEGFSFMKYIMSTYYSVMGTSEETKALFATVGETCYSDEYCDGTSNNGSNRLLTFLLTTATSVLLFTLGYYYIDNRRQDGRLIGQINSLQRDLLSTTKESEILKEELLSTKNKLAGIEDSSFGMDDMVQSLKEEINELKATNDRLRNSLDDNEKLLRVSENTAGELQNTLSEVENTLSELLAERANSEEQIVELNGKIQAFEEELISVSRERDNFQLKYVSAESALEEFKKQKKQLEDVNQQLSEAKNTIELQKHELNALKDALKELKGGMPSNVDVTSLIDHTEIKAKLSKALEEKKAFETKYETEHKERTRLAEELQSTQETLHTTSQNATEALTRLDVLGKYFQERESELLKELSAKESLWLSKQGESASTVEKIELLQQEVQRHKEKCDALTLELAEQESSRRSALSAVEARAHAAWLEARAAKRDADAARDDAAALRRKLASLSALSAGDGAASPLHKVASPLENADNPMIPPPLPPMFLPPPPPLLPPLPRPPPLGRLPSPPRYGDRRYSPDSRYSPESRYSPDSRYSPETVRYSPDSRYSPRNRRSPYSPRSRRRSRSRERYEMVENRGSRSRNGPADTETEYNSDSPSREPRRRGRYSRHSGPSSGSGCSSESDK
ncbi:uncharacterized protein LOC142975372 isoform X1 [Anticarsia gemmatalis]|uniref:uncharacterized protein LOC142975372 isoform X1 n=1 Tax=Anticarsia gemmatalis TaxID=129554 RepID=UPI003F76B64C